MEKSRVFINDREIVSFKEDEETFVNTEIQYPPDEVLVEQIKKEINKKLGTPIDNIADVTFEGNGKVTVKIIQTTDKVDFEINF